MTDKQNKLLEKNYLSARLNDFKEIKSKKVNYSFWIGEGNIAIMLINTKTNKNKLVRISDKNSKDIHYVDVLKEILKDFMKTEYGITLKNYDDTATMIYDIENQPVYAGGSGPACAPLVTYGYIFHKMKKKEIKRVLLVATGALHSTSMVNEKHSIPGIAHAISLEVIE